MVPWVVNSLLDERVLRDALEQYVDNMKESLAEFGDDNERALYRSATTMLEELETRLVRRAESTGEQNDGKQPEGCPGEDLV